MKKRKSISIGFGKNNLPYLKSNKKAFLTYKEEKNTVEIIGNKVGLKLLAKALLGVAETEIKGYHIHIDDLYITNEENKELILAKIEK